MILLVSYDLRVPGRNYDALYETLKSAPNWWHYLESTWIIKTSEDVKAWNQRLIKVIDQNDRLFIVNITGQARNGWLPQKAWSWLKENSN